MDNNGYPVNPSFNNPNPQNPTPPPLTAGSAPVPAKPAKGSAGSTVKKILLVSCLGLFLGIFTGIGFQAVNVGSGYIYGNTEQASETTGQERSTPMPRTERNTSTEAEGDGSASVRPESPVIRQAILEDTAQNSIIYTVTDVTQVVEAVMPAVVSVSNFYTETYSYFGRQFSDEGEASGSGIIVGENESELLIVTNYHVVQGANSLNIKFVDDSVAEAQVKGSQPNMDLAIVAVNLADLSDETIESIAIATLGDSDQLKVGEPAIAIGNAMGYGQSVTTGVISALGRQNSYYTGGGYGDQGYNIEGEFIQTDAAINFGNSGGALVNIRGEVIGINSSKIGGSAIEGMGFAIPISAAKPIIDELMAQETRARVDQANQGFLGINGVTVDNETAGIYGLPKGVYVQRVIEGTAAEKYGLEEGDIITHVDGVEVGSMEELQRRLTYYSAGEEVTLTLMRGEALRGYRERNITLILGSRIAE
jgi:serine protease Do